MKKLIILAILLLVNFIIQAQIPVGYYDSAAGKTGALLKTALYNIIKGHTVLSYSGLDNQMQVTDVKPGNIVWDMYSDIPEGNPPYIYHFISSDQCGSYNSEGDCWNKEHSFPKSWFNDVAPMNSDLFHLYPTDGKVNGMRSNYPYGVVGTATDITQNGSKLGQCNFPGCTGIVFEPVNAYKGDFARTYFYMVTRYENVVASWQTDDPNGDRVLNGTAFPAFESWALTMLLQWSGADTVSQKEIDRNNAVYSFQHNRNPFIDHPEYIDSIWGNPSSIENISASNLNIEMYPNPASEETIISVISNSSVKFNVCVYNNIGENIYSAFSLLNKFNVNLNNICNGSYTVRISTDSGKYQIKKLIVIK